MSNIITIGLATEGPTDIRFLQNIVLRTFEKIAFECQGEIEVFEPAILGKTIGSFQDAVTGLAKVAKKQGIMVWCVHADADGPDDKIVQENKFIPAKAILELKGNDELCNNLVAIIPVQMTEAWMLADHEVLLNEIGADKTIRELVLDRPPEQIADPKDALIQAIRIAFEHLPRRRRPDLKIGDLYLPLGQKTRLSELERLDSYQAFKEEVRNAFKN